MQMRFEQWENGTLLRVRFEVAFDGESESFWAATAEPDGTVILVCPTPPHTSRSPLPIAAPPRCQRERKQFGGQLGGQLGG